MTTKTTQNDINENNPLIDVVSFMSIVLHTIVKYDLNQQDRDGIIKAAHNNEKAKYLLFSLLRSSNEEEQDRAFKELMEIVEAERAKNT